MSVNPQRNNFSQIIAKYQHTDKIRPILNRSLRKIQPNHNYSWFLMAAKEYYHKTNNLKQAINNFQQYIQHNPSHQQSLYLCGICYMHVGEYTKAIQKLKQYLATKKIPQNQINRKLIINSYGQLPNINHAYLLLSIAYNKIDHLSKSIQAVNQALRLDNKFQQAYCFRAKLYLKIGENQKAFYDYKQALRSNNQCLSALIGLGDYYTQINNYNQAYYQYQKAKNNINNNKDQILIKKQYNDNILNKQYQHQNIIDQEDQLQISNIKNQDNCYVKKKYSQDHSYYHQKIFNRKQRIFHQSHSLEKQYQRNHFKQGNKLKLKLSAKNNINPGINSLTPSNRNRYFRQSPFHNYKFDPNMPKTYIHSHIENKYPQKLQQLNQKIIDSEDIQPKQQIQVKIAICLYFLQEYQKSMESLQELLKNKNNKCNKNNSEIFYYLAVNQLKLHQRSKNGIKLTNNNKSELQVNSSKIVNKKKFIDEIISSSKNQKQSSQNKPLNSSQWNKHHSYLQQAILNLQLSIKSNSNKKIMIKSCKTLIKIYIQNNQFYETQFVIKLAQKYEIQITNYKQLCQACMLVIKQKYTQSITILKKLYINICQKYQDIEKDKDKKSIEIKTKNNCKIQINNDAKCATTSKKSNNCQEKQIQKQKQTKIQINVQQNQYFNTDQQKIKKNKTIQLQSPQHFNNQQKQFHSNRKCYIKKNQLNKFIQQQQKLLQYNPNHFNQFTNLSIKNKFNNKNNCKQQLVLSPTINTSNLGNQFQWMKPILLLFRAYSQYFSDNFIQCLELYEQYQSYIKDYHGEQPQTDIYLSYNKILCEGILMLDNQMFQESLQKFKQCTDNYYRLLKGVPATPIIFRVLGLIRISLSQTPYISQQVNSREKILSSALKILDHYMPLINNNCLIHYYYGLLLYWLQKYKEASESLQKCLKHTDECLWKYLYVKGIIELKNKMYRDAARQFSAGLIVQQRSQIYLGRCISFIQLFDQAQGDDDQHVYMEKSFQDLQKFIQLQEDKDKISKWVTKILFFNRAYQEVTKSIIKISNQTLQNCQELGKIMKCLHIYNGSFEDGGILGQILINAFQGKFEQSTIQISGQRHEIALGDFVDGRYIKWLNILNLYSSQRYSQLIKYLQIAIFEQKIQQQSVQLRYNLAIIYYLTGELNKADNVMSGLTKYLQDIKVRVDKFITRDFSLDQCIDDLQVQMKGVKRLSTYLPYRKINFDQRSYFVYHSEKQIHVKISLPFPTFFKPNIDIELDDAFLYGETAQACIPKKIQAPWIKKVTGNIQFTQNIVQSLETSILDCQQYDDLQIQQQ